MEKVELATIVHPITVTSAFCEDPDSFVWGAVVAGTERKYLIGSDTIPNSYTFPSATQKNSQNECVNFFDADTLHADLKDFATYTASTHTVTFAKITAEKMYGLHKIPVSLNTAGGKDFGETRDLNVVLSKDGCEAPKLAVTSGAISDSTVNLKYLFDASKMFVMNDAAGVNAGCLQRYTMEYVVGDASQQSIGVDFDSSCDMADQACYVTLPGKTNVDDVHRIKVTASSTMNVALLENGVDKTAAVNYLTLTKYTANCETKSLINLGAGSGLTKSVPAPLTLTHYRMTAVAKEIEYAPWTLEKPACNLLYTLVPPAALAKYVTLSSSDRFKFSV